MTESQKSTISKRKGLVSDFEKMLTKTFEEENIGIGVKTDSIGYKERMDGRYYGLVREYTFPQFLKNIPLLRILAKTEIKKVIEIHCSKNKIIASELEAGEWPDIRVKIKYDPDTVVSKKANEFIQEYRNQTNKNAELEYL